MTLTNPFKAALAAGQTQLGLWQSLASPVTAELCATLGFDWLLFDGEHGPNDIPLLQAQLQAVAPYDSCPVGRVPVGDLAVIKQYLDIGFLTLLVPMVESGQQAALMSRAVRYAPGGLRGVGAGIARASRWGAIPDYLAAADDQVCLLLQVESRAGVADLAAIAATAGVDGVFIGPADLAADMGVRGQPGHDDVQAVIAAAVTTIHAAGKAAGILATDAAMARRYLDLGFNFVAVGVDALLLRDAAKQALATFRV